MALTNAPASKSGHPSAAMLIRRARPKRVRALAAAGALLYAAALCAAAAHLAAVGVWLPCGAAVARYEIRGVDVSAYQGDIDWPVLAAQGLHFAYIKATEGSGHVDARFAFNWREIARTPLRAGAYHFFSFDSSGSAQADHFIDTVPAADGMLPPAIDLEFYQDHALRPPPKSDVVRELTVMIHRLTAAYGMTPILYTTLPMYERYVSGEFSGVQVWIASVWRAPELPDGRACLIWQYSSRGRLRGYRGDQPRIDLNAFCSSRAIFERFAR